MSGDSKEGQVPVEAIPAGERFTRLTNIFNGEFNDKPSFFARVPGRVNLIGEHIDYCGYPVLPMALEQDILIAVGITEERELRIRNLNKKYVPFDYILKTYEDIEIKPDSDGKPFWYNYVLCGIKGAMEFSQNNFKYGLQLYVDGNIPPASGLSSSSALVSAACLSFLYANGEMISKSEIASLCASSERYIGTQGGGMDQAIAFLAEKYSAQYITWQPLKATAVTLPNGVTFVVAHSLAEANKAATNDFNRRVMECRLAAKVLATVTGATTDTKVITLSQVHKALDKSLEDMVKLVHKHLPQTIYSKNDICNILNVSKEDLENIYLTPNTRHITEFKLQQRALHVYEEAIRVEKFRKICAQSKPHSNGNGTTNGHNGYDENKCNETETGNIIEELGKLISQSHESLKSLYECSHDNLDRLVEISKDMNIHSRLTGAGWGGCIVALCPKKHVEVYLEMLKDRFYDKHCNMGKSVAKSFVFSTTPNHGAVVYI